MREWRVINRATLATTYVVALLLVVLSMIVRVAGAIEVTPTVLPKNGTVIITAYKANVIDTTPAASASNKLFTIGEVYIIELFNSGNAPVDLAEVRLLDTANPARELLFNKTERAGWLEPGKHVVLATDGAVSNETTYALLGWSNAAELVATRPASISVVYGGNRPSSVDISGDNILRKRTFGSASYNTTFQDAMSPSDTADVTLWDRLYDDGLYAPPATADGLAIIEIYPYSSSCSLFDSSILCGDYIKIANTSGHAIDLDEYVLRTDSSSANRTAANTFSLAGTLQPGETYLVHRTDAGGAISLTNSGGYVWFEDIWGIEQYIDTAAHYESAGSSRQGYSYALAEDGTWQWTSTPQPYGDNTITVPIAEAAPCPEGKYRNPDTNRCRNIEDVISDLVPCGEGKERSPETNRCRNIASSASSLTPCKEGQERNPATNRCRSIASAIAELLPCDEGYERNPATNRCRKVKDANVLGAEYPVEPYKQEGVALATWWAVGGIAALAVGYGVWEWRREIGAGLARVLRRGK